MSRYSKAEDDVIVDMARLGATTRDIVSALKNKLGVTRTCASVDAHLNSLRATMAVPSRGHCQSGRSGAITLGGQSPALRRAVAWSRRNETIAAPLAAPAPLPAPVCRWVDRKGAPPCGDLAVRSSRRDGRPVYCAAHAEIAFAPARAPIRPRGDW